MSQKEQYEVVCKRCGRKDILDHEPLEDYVCSICGPISKPIEYSKNKPYEINIKPKAWVCGNHNLVLKKDEPCPECEKKQLRPLITPLNPTNNEYEKIRDDIDISKTEWGVMKKIRDHRIALEKTQLAMPTLLKQSIKQQAKLNNEILKQLKQLNKNLEGKNGS